jgi:DNA/RNA endonuclease YhcR with UshA esterase domain
MISVTGTVAVLPNVLGTQYFYIVGSPGVQVYMYKKDFPKLAVGDVVKITGELSEVSGETRLKISEKEDIEFVEHTALPASHPIEIASVGEEYEGWLIEVHGEVTEAKSSYMYVDDGTDEVQVYYKSGAGINAKLYQPGDLVRVTGILSQTKTGYRLLPRAQSDVVKTGVVDDVIVRQEAIKEESSKEVAEKYLTATAGGLTALLVGLLAKTRADTLRTIFKSIQNGLQKLFRKKK